MIHNLFQTHEQGEDHTPASDSGAAAEILQRLFHNRVVERLLFDEIVPVLDGYCDDPKGFAHSVLDRGRNPFFDHQLSAIALNHEAKMAVRLAPTRAEFVKRFGHDPEILASLLS